MKLDISNKFCCWPYCSSSKTGNTKLW